MVSVGDVLSYSSQISTGFTQSPDSVLNTVSENLSSQYGLQVRNSNVSGGLLGELGAAITFSSQQVNVTMQVQTTTAWNQPDDIRSVIDNQFYSVTGELPSASSINDSSNSSAGVAEPATVAPASSGSSFLSKLSSFGSGTAVGVALAGLGIVILLAASASGKVAAKV